MDAFARDGEELDAVRGRLLAEIDSAMQGAEQVARNAESGMGDLFGGPLADARFRSWCHGGSLGH